MIIDFHTHVFPDKIAPETLRALSGASNILPSTDGTAQGLSRSMEKAGIGLSVNLPVLTRPSQADRVNDSLLDSYETMLDMGILTFGGMHPGYVGFREKLHMLAQGGMKGIKLHPAYQKTDLDDPSMMRIIDAASQEGLVVLIHAGLDIGIPGHDYSDLHMILRVLDEVRPPKMVLAHMGGWQNWEDVGRYLAGADVWLDTAFSIGKIDAAKKHEDPSGGQADEMPCNMEPEAFLSLCRKHGTDRILFGTDCPWADQHTYVEEIRSLPLSDAQKADILGGNAAKLLALR